MTIVTPFIGEGIPMNLFDKDSMFSVIFFAIMSIAGIVQFILLFSPSARRWINREPEEPGVVKDAVPT
ncbi:MAG: hypothetical protein COB93_09975 [Sneathiella sp.]|nr:MAG: hypothetical protein COB93_09975 [Sneathiella sp.]